MKTATKTINQIDEGRISVFFRRILKEAEKKVKVICIIFLFLFFFSMNIGKKKK